MSIVPKWKALKITELALWTPTLSEEHPPAEGQGQEEVQGATGTEHPVALRVALGLSGQAPYTPVHRTWYIGVLWEMASGSVRVQDVTRGRVWDGNLPGSRGKEQKINYTEKMS